MNRTQQAALNQRLTVIACFDLVPEAIDRAAFATLDADLWLDAEDLEYSANDIVITDRAATFSSLAARAS